MKLIDKYFTSNLQYHIIMKKYGSKLVPFLLLNFTVKVNFKLSIGNTYENSNKFYWNLSELSSFLLRFYHDTKYHNLISKIII